MRAGEEVGVRESVEKSEALFFRAPRMRVLKTGVNLVGGGGKLWVDKIARSGMGYL